MSERCVIVGAGHGAAQLCASLVEMGWNGRITLIGDEPALPYHRPFLSKGFLDPAGAQPLPSIRPEAFYITHRIEFLGGTRVERIDRANRTVQAGGSAIAYDKLVLCTGSIHRRPPVAGLDHPRIHGLRNAAEAARLRDAAARAARIGVIGAGFIGLEAAASLRKLGREVTVFELADRVLSRVTSPPVSRYFEQLHRGHGVDLRTGISVREVRENGQGLLVVDGDGNRLACDLVVTGTGALPDTRLAEAAGLAVDDGILVSETNATSDPDIFALGDCCRQHHPLYRRHVRLESVQNAVDQAKVVAHALAGRSPPPPALPWFWSDQFDVKLQMAGLPAGHDTAILRGRPETGAAFSVWYLRNGTPIAVDAINDAAAYAAGTRLIRSRRRPDPVLLANPGTALKTIIEQATEADHA